MLFIRKEKKKEKKREGMKTLTHIDLRKFTCKPQYTTRRKFYSNVLINNPIPGHAVEVLKIS
jgi:hypothetical protein